MVPGPSSEETEQLLRDLPAFKILGLLHGASNYTFLAQLGPHRPSGVRIVYKPAKGESPLWDFDAGSLYRREVAAYELSKVLGWPRIPPTVVRKKAPHGVGAVQLIIAAELRALARRLRAVLGPDWRFPEPSSAWTIPWPPV